MAMFVQTFELRGAHRVLTSFAQADDLVELEIAHHHLAEPAEVGIEARRRGSRRLVAAGAQQSGIVRRLHYHAVADGFWMARDQPVLMEELVVPEAFMHADGLPHVLDRDRVARGADRDQGIVGHPARPHQLVAIRRSRAQAE